VESYEMAEETCSPIAASHHDDALAAVEPAEEMTMTGSGLSQQQQQQQPASRWQVGSLRTIKEMDGHVLDLDIVTVYLSQDEARLEPDEKCYRYYKAIERYLYKRDPGLKLDQFQFVEQTNASTGEVSHVFVPSTKVDVVTKYCKRYAPAFVAPVLGVVLSGLWKGLSAQQLE
jgi:hypothetical protein